MQGKGLAALVVATWIEQMGASRHLFYSTMEEDAASHRVADKVDGVPLGRITRTWVDDERLATARSHEPIGGFWRSSQQQVADEFDRLLER